MTEGELPGLPRGKWDGSTVLASLADLPPELPRGADVPDDLDPLAEGVLMKHQSEWLADDSDLKLGEKGRRTGITFAEATDATLISSSAPSAGGQNYFYIGDTKDKGREFIGYVAKFAKTIADDLGQIEEFLFEDELKDGSTRYIAAYRVRFRSGYRVEALSSRPENIRGLQGTVCIDEAAYHRDVRGVLDAVNALLIWGGKIRVISTHNGVLNPFNELIREAHAGKIPFSVHHIPFALAVKNGLFRRVCMLKGEEWTQAGQDAWEKKIRGSYGVRLSAMRQELDAIPADQAGAALTRVQIESRMEKDIPILRYAQTDDFKNWGEEDRTAEALKWCKENLIAVLERLDHRRQHVFGVDFARSGDATAIVLMEIGQDLVRRTRFIVELHNMPFDQQREILFYVCDRIPSLAGGALDAGGNGSYLAEKATQRYGSSIIEVKFSEQWYRREMTAYVAAFGDQTIVLPLDADVLADHQALAYVSGGYIKVPDGHRFKGANGFNRHGDTAIAGALAYFASRSELEYFGYTTVDELDTMDGVQLFEAVSTGDALIPTLNGGLH